MTEKWGKKPLNRYKDFFLIFGTFFIELIWKLRQ
jgi:hypothetical protein